MVAPRLRPGLKPPAANGRRPEVPCRRRGSARPSRAGEGGYALLVALLVIFVVSIALSLVALSLAIQMRSARDEARGIELTTLCDAALAQTLSGLAAGNSSGMPSHDFGGGQISSTVQQVDQVHFNVTAVAAYDGRQRTVQAQVVHDAGGTRVVAWQRLSG